MKAKQWIGRAEFSETGTFRYRLWRVWGKDEGNCVLWIMLNPSTADAQKNDPTVARCFKRSVDMGYDAMQVCNLFAFRSTDPKELYAMGDPIGPRNDEAIVRAMSGSAMIICGWGVHGDHMERGAYVRRLIRSHDRVAYCLGLTKEGQPRHPLYLGYGEPLEPLPEFRPLGVK